MKTLIILTVLSLTLLKELVTFRKPPMKVIPKAGDDMNTGENRSMREKKSRNRYSDAAMGTSLRIFAVPVIVLKADRRNLNLYFF
jgi:hypothetical protein